MREEIFGADASDVHVVEPDVGCVARSLRQRPGVDVDEDDRRVAERESLHLPVGSGQGDDIAVVGRAVGAKEAAVAAGRIGIADVETPVVLSAQIVYDAGEMLSVRNVRERIYG